VIGERRRDGVAGQICVPICFAAKDPPTRRARPQHRRVTGAIVFVVMALQPRQHLQDLDGERVRRLRLQADGQRPLVVNLEETILLTRKLFELRDAALRAR
jgi:hypothetical protein